MGTLIEWMFQLEQRERTQGAEQINDHQQTIMMADNEVDTHTQQCVTKLATMDCPPKQRGLMKVQLDTQIQNTESDPWASVYCSQFDVALIKWPH